MLTVEADVASREDRLYRKHHLQKLMMILLEEIATDNGKASIQWACEKLFFRSKNMLRFNMHSMEAGDQTWAAIQATT